MWFNLAADFRDRLGVGRKLAIQILDILTALALRVVVEMIIYCATIIISGKIRK